MRLLWLCCGLALGAWAMYRLAQVVAEMMSLMLLAQVAPGPVEPAVSVANPLIAALIAAALLLIPALTAWGIKVIKDRMEANKDAIAAKIAENTAVTKEVKHLVDGTRGMLLQRLADTLAALARVSKDPEDLARAATAHKEAKEHADALLVAAGEAPREAREG